MARVTQDDRSFLSHPMLAHNTLIPEEDKVKEFRASAGLLMGKINCQIECPC